MRVGNILSATALGAALLAAGCDNGPSAVETRDRSGEPVALAAAAEAAPGEAPRRLERRASRPRWSSTSRYTAEQNAERAFQRNGAAFGAATVDEYVARAHAFIAEPPAGTRTLRRRNGDTLYYHEASNTFAVATAEGAPRTLFKPDQGAAYWAEQEQREAGRSEGAG